MEHIVQFAIGIDDDAIKKRITDSAEKQIKDELMKDIKSAIEHEIFDMYRGPWDKEAKRIGLQNWCKELVVQTLNKHEDKIVELAAEKLADKLSRTKAIKEAMAAKVAGETEEE